MTETEPVPTDLRSFQAAFSEYIRTGDPNKLPHNLPQRQAGLYRSLLFTNVCGFIDRCFPVAKGLHSKAEWESLCKVFFQVGRCRTPYFKKIPREFVEFFVHRAPEGSEPSWLNELLHYEWVELATQIAPGSVAADAKIVTGLSILTANTTLHNLTYQWPVHMISKLRPPTVPQSVRLLVFRDAQHKTRFIEINAVTAKLVQLIQEEPRPLEEQVQILSAQLAYGHPDQLLGFAVQLSQDLHARQALSVA